MSTEENEVEIEEDFLKTISEDTILVSILEEGNGACTNSNYDEINQGTPNNQPKAETPSSLSTLETPSPGNCAIPEPSEVMDTNTNPLGIAGDNEQNSVETGRVTVKEEPPSEQIAHDIPSAETSNLTIATQSEQIFDMESNTPIPETASIIKWEEGIEDNLHLKEVAAKISRDEYLDGIETPIARLRVRAEFAVPEICQREASDDRNSVDRNSGDMNTLELLLPPPPLFSSNSNSDVADGIATPRISLASISRLRVKSEFSIPSSTPQQSNEDHFDGNLEDNTESIESGEVSPNASDDASEDETIPPDFFDDLLHDKLKERIEEFQNDDLEEKYSDRLKEYERLKQKSGEEKSKTRQKNRKKQKKSKKKSRKRSRSRSLSPNSEKKIKTFTELPRLSSYDRNIRNPIAPSHSDDMPSCSKYAHLEYVGQNCFRMGNSAVIKSEFPANDYENTAKESEHFESVEELDLTPRQKRERAIKRATDLLEYIRENSDDNSSKFSSFPFVSTVRKLPTSRSYVHQQSYENRSPLHTVNNVSYKFNSLNTRFNLEDWGLASLPPQAAKIAKLVGCDAEFIHNKLKTIKIPTKLRKVKQEPINDDANEEEELIETTSSLYTNAMTQTDDLSEFNSMSQERGCEIGVQIEPEMYSIACQTLETQSPTTNLHKDDDAPIMKILRGLNENQLMAIHAFAEFIKEPNPNGSAMEMYKVQMKILDIYKMSQIPSALLTAENPIVNNYTTVTTNHRNPQQISIQSVKGADGKQFSVDDPRSTSAKRNVYDNGVASGYDSRYSSGNRYSQSSHNRSPRNVGRYSSSSNNIYCNPSVPSVDASTTKHYGRGGLRR